MKPLTIEQLKSLEVGEWAWVVDKDYKEGYYAQISYQDISAVTIDSNIGGLEEIYDSDYGTKWLAYKNKEQSEAKGEIVELPCLVEIPCKAFGTAFKNYHLLRLNSDGMLITDVYSDGDKDMAKRRLAELKGV